MFVEFDGPGSVSGLVAGDDAHDNRGVELWAEGDDKRGAQVVDRIGRDRAVVSETAVGGCGGVYVTDCKG